MRWLSEGRKVAARSRRSDAFGCVFVRLIGCTRVASVQSEPGQQNLLIQPPLGRKRGLRQVSLTFLLILSLSFHRRHLCLAAPSPPVVHPKK